MLLKSLQVEEGSEAVITSDNIKVLQDFEKFGISSSAVLFHIIEFPKHGELSFGPHIKKRKVFSLAQLRSNKIVYIHNAKESVGDSFVFEIEIDPGLESDLPPFLASRQRYFFQIRVLPVNDPPDLRGNLGNVMMIAEGTKMALPSNFLQVRIRFYAARVHCWD